MQINKNNLENPIEKQVKNIFGKEDAQMKNKNMDG